MIFKWFCCDLDIWFFCLWFRVSLSLRDCWSQQNAWNSEKCSRNIGKLLFHIPKKSNKMRRTIFLRTRNGKKQHFRELETSKNNISENRKQQKLTSHDFRKSKTTKKQHFGEQETPKNNISENRKHQKTTFQRNTNTKNVQKQHFWEPETQKKQHLREPQTTKTSTSKINTTEMPNWLRRDDRMGWVDRRLTSKQHLFVSFSTPVAHEEPFLQWRVSRQHGWSAFDCVKFGALLTSTGFTNSNYFARIILHVPLAFTSAQRRTQWQKSHTCTPTSLEIWSGEICLNESKTQWYPRQVAKMPEMPHPAWKHRCKNWANGWNRNCISSNIAQIDILSQAGFFHMFTDPATNAEMKFHIISYNQT